MTSHVLKWLAPAPLWRGAVENAERLPRPAILRFASDSFMEDFLALLERDPDSISELEARHETWRKPLSSASRLNAPIAVERQPRRVLAFARQRLEQKRSGLLSARGGVPSTDEYRLKLYQPAHQRYYLVTASLVCAKPGFPDRSVDLARQERVSFVLRRLVPRQGSLTDALPAMDPSDLSLWDEYAFVQGTSGPSWRKAPRPRERVDGEEPLSMFPVAFRDHREHRRRLLAGVIPVARRETYLGAPRDDGEASSDPEDRTSDPRRLLFFTQVIGPWKSLVESNDYAAAQVKANDESELGIDRKTLKKEARERVQTGSWYLLQELRELLAEHLPNVLSALISGNEAELSSERHAEELALFHALQDLSLAGIAAPLTSAAETVAGTSHYSASSVAASLGAALAAVAGENSQRLDRAVDSYDRERAASVAAWPDFLFPFADPGKPTPLLPKIDVALVGDEVELERQLRTLDRLTDLIGGALPPLPDEPQPAVAANAKQNIDPRDGWFVVRCVYEQPECGALHPALVSEPTHPFQLAAFFDPDAPARPIRIGLPIDPTPAGLRKFDKKTFVVISNLLCGHIDRVKQLSLGDLVLSVLPWPFHKSLSVPERGPCTTPDNSGLALGMMCSLSLPIITLCAVLLLMIMVSLLDLIFRWVPYFTVCFPIPGLKGKSGAAA